MFKNYRIRDYNFKLIIMVVAITVIGILAIGSAKESVQNKQIIGAIMGLFLMIVLSFFDYSFFLRFHWLIYVFNLSLLLMVAIFGETVNNAKRWLEIGGIQFQPSETTKIMLILFFSQFIMKHRENINSLKNIILLCFLLLPPLYLVYEQPDMSTSIVIIIVFCVIWYIGGLDYKIIVGALSIAIPVAVIFFIMVLQPDQTLINEYQQRRILAWLEPEKYATTTAYQQTNAMIGVLSPMTYEKYTGREAFVSLADEPYLHIAPKAFLSCKTIESLKLPMTLETIGDWAFAHMHNLTDLYLPANHITLGKKVFLDCENLQRIHVMGETSGNEGLAEMLGAAITILGNTDLLQPHLVGSSDTHKDWLADFDTALEEFLISEDNHGFEPVFYGWFNDDDVYSTQLPLYLKKKRTGKLTLAFLRLRYSLHLEAPLKQLLQAYLADHMPWGAKAEDHTITWDLLPEYCRDELIYIQILEHAGAFEPSHIPTLIDHLQDASAEVIAYLLNLHTANKCTDDFFTHFSL